MADAVLRVILADDHPVFRAGLRGVLDRMTDATVVAEAGDGADVVRLTTEHRPDVVLMDLHMPGLGGVEATRRITAAHPDVAVVVLTMLEDDGSVLAALRAGARGYLLKGADEAEIAASLRIVAAGGIALGPLVGGRMVEVLTGDLTAPAAPFPELTERERDVLRLLARGRSNPAIAAELHLGRQTVRNYVSSIFAKLDVADRGEAIVRARDAGLR
ncbi:MAG: response regulator [Pseudonocardia sp.]